MATEKFNELVFKHLIDMPMSQCVFCSTREKESGRSKLYLVFEEKNRIYKRNGLNSTWNELTSEEETVLFRSQYDDCLKERNIPCYTTATR